ncbi:MAG: type 1 glutamine amidotransferase [Spirochaetes bacterium]|nr:type 1 glutamine amidotransferase [Spirochaetota bacterium]
MSKKIAVLVEDLYHVIEMWVPYYRLKEEGYEALLVGTGSASKYHSKEGYEAVPEVSIKDIKSDDFDGVIIPGGFAPDKLRRYSEITQFVNKLCTDGKLTASICHGPWVLVSSNVLKGRKVTCTSAIKDDIINAGAEYLDKEVVIDKNLITSRTPKDIPVFCREIIDFLQKK